MSSSRDLAAGELPCMPGVRGERRREGKVRGERRGKEKVRGKRGEENITSLKESTSVLVESI